MIGWDPPGYGASRPEDRTFPLDFFDRDAEMSVELMAKLGFKEFSAVGWSDGGITGLVAAAEFPNAIKVKMRIIFSNFL